MLERTDGADAWTSFALTGADVLCIPEAGIELPVAEFYEGVDIATAEGQA